MPVANIKSGPKDPDKKPTTKPIPSSSGSTSRLEMLKLAESHQRMAEVALKYSAYCCDPDDELIDNVTISATGEVYLIASHYSA